MSCSVRIPRLLSRLILFVVIGLVTGVSRAAAQSPGTAPCDIRTSERIVAVGDVHGAYDRFVDILRAAGLVDGQVRWTGGRAIRRARRSRGAYGLVVSSQKHGEQSLQEFRRLTFAIKEDLMKRTPPAAVLVLLVALGQRRFLQHSRQPHRRPSLSPLSRWRRSCSTRTRRTNGGASYPD